MIPTITTFGWVPEFARGFVRDMRPRWAFEEVGQPYAVDLITNSKSPEHRRFQPFGQVPTYQDDEVAIFESGAIVLRIAERAGKLIPADPAARMRALQWVAAALNSVEPFVMALAVNDIFEADREWSKARHVKVVDDLKTRLGDLEAALGDKDWLDGDRVHRRRPDDDLRSGRAAPYRRTRRSPASCRLCRAGKAGRRT